MTYLKKIALYTSTFEADASPGTLHAVSPVTLIAAGLGLERERERERVCRWHAFMHACVLMLFMQTE